MHQGTSRADGGGVGCSEVGLLVSEPAGEGVHYLVLAELGPHEVHLVDLFLVVEQPPVPGFEEGSDEDRVVAFSHKALVLLSGVRDLFFAAGNNLTLRRHVLFLHYSTKIGDDFFLYGINLLPSAFQNPIRKLDFADSLLQTHLFG